MDNDGKVTELIEQSKLAFLREALENLKNDRQQYDLGKEFAATRKNRTPMVAGIILATIAVFGVGAWAVTLYIQRSSNRVAVTIKDFQEVNLREVLDAAKRLDTQMQDAQSQKSNLESERDAQIALAKQSAQQQIQLLTTESLSDEQVKERTAAINHALQIKIASIQADYATRIAEVDAQIKNISAQQAQYDSRQVEQARQQEEVLNNQRKLFDMQLQQQKQDYEAKIADLTTGYEKQIADLKAYHTQFVAALEKKHQTEIQALIAKYNPTYSDAAIVGLLSSPIDASLLQKPTLADFQNLLATDNVISRDAYNRIAANLADYETIIQRLEQVPYENSVPQALKQLEYRNISLIRSLESIWSGLAGLIDKKDAAIASADQTIAEQNRTIATRNQAIGTLTSRIGQYSYALDSLVQADRENGYIIDPRDPNNILVYIDKIRQVTDGTTALVFRNDDQSIGVIRFSVSGGTTRASLVKLSADQQLMPFDKILIQVQQ